MSGSSKFTEYSNDRKRAGIYVWSAVVGLVSGLIVVAYRMTILFLETKRRVALSFVTHPVVNIVIWLCAAGAMGLVTAIMLKSSPHINGSGIPQVKAFLMRRIRFDWKKELPFKFIGGSLALGAGLSLGREGPSIQLGALTGAALTELTGKHEYQRYLVTAGAAAGISAAFNAPLAGVLFCIEELHRSVSPVMLTSSLIASFSANVVMWAFFGHAPIFGISLANVLPVEMYIVTIPLIGVASALVGTIFSRGIVWTQSMYRRVVPSEMLRLVSAFVVAAGVCLVVPALNGGGHPLVESLIHTERGPWLVAALIAGKLVFTLFSYGSGAPGGIFLPLLAIGALIGALCAFPFNELGLPEQYLPNYILLGMAGFFTAVVRAPITGAVLITEMAGSFAHFPAFILVAVVASLGSGILRNKPIYDILLAKLAPDRHDGAHPSPVTLYIPVFEGSVLEKCSTVVDKLPEGCILVAVERGESELFPDKDIDIHPGDVLQVVVDRNKAHRYKERLLELARAPSGNIEAN